MFEQSPQNSLFAKITLADVHQDVARNIVSLRESQNLFDDLTEYPSEWVLAQKVEDELTLPMAKARGFSVYLGA